MEPLMSRLKKMADKFEASTNAVKEVQDQELLDFTARKLVEMAADIIMCHLLIQDASKSSELFSKSAHVYLNYAEAEVEKHTNFIENFDKEDLAFYKK
jgi:acyl-coA dehydrogenase